MWVSVIQLRLNIHLDNSVNYVHSFLGIPFLDFDLLRLPRLSFLSTLLFFSSLPIVIESNPSEQVRLCIQGTRLKARSKVVAFLAPLGVCVLSNRGGAANLLLFVLSKVGKWLFGSHLLECVAKYLSFNGTAVLFDSVLTLIGFFLIWFSLCASIVAAPYRVAPKLVVYVIVF